MDNDENVTKDARFGSRIPSNSFFYEKIVPGILISLGIVMVGLIFFAAAIILGLISY